MSLTRMLSGCLIAPWCFTDGYGLGSWVWLRVIVWYDHNSSAASFLHKVTPLNSLRSFPLEILPGEHDLDVLVLTNLRKHFKILKNIQKNTAPTLPLKPYRTILPRIFLYPNTVQVRREAVVDSEKVFLQKETRLGLRWRAVHKHLRPSLAACSSPGAFSMPFLLIMLI